MDNIRRKADNFSLSYKKAMELSLQPGCTTKACATAIASHYGPNLVSFAYGTFSQMAVYAKRLNLTTIDVVDQHLQKFDKAGWGWKIRLVKHNVQPLSPSSAQCWLTWEIEPANGIQGWQWTNIYGFRLPPDGRGGFVEKGYWEYAISDNEIGEVMLRRPDFMDLVK